MVVNRAKVGFAHREHGCVPVDDKNLAETVVFELVL
jgi:hypothetical protein